MTEAEAEFEASSVIAAPVEPPSPPAEPREQTAGTLLWQAREAAGLSRADVANKLKFSVKQIETVETDNFIALGGKTFVRGVVRTYAKILIVDAGTILAALDRSTLPPETGQVAADPKGVPFPTAATPVSPVLRYAVISIGVIAGGIVLLYLWHGDEFLSGPAVSPAPPKAAMAIQPVPPGASSTMVTLAPIVVETPIVAERAPTANSKTVDKPVESIRESAGEKPAPVLPPAPGAGSGAGRRILFTFERDAWVEVKDANGRIVFSQLNLAGTQQVVEGRAPFELVVGNAGFVRLRYRDAQVDLKPHTKADVARLNLN